MSVTTGFSLVLISFVLVRTSIFLTNYWQLPIEPATGFGFVVGTLYGLVAIMIGSEK